VARQAGQQLEWVRMLDEEVLPGLVADGEVVGEVEQVAEAGHVAVVLVQGPVGLAWVEQIVTLLQLQATASVLMQLMMTVTIHPMPHPSSSTLACLP